MMAVIEHPDMPKGMLGIQGLNPWNILLAVIVIAWFFSRKREGLVWDLPRSISILLALYMLVILISFFRMLIDPAGLFEYYRSIGSELPTTTSLISEYFINCFKWVIPGLLIFDGCRNRQRLLLGLTALLGVYFLLGVQVIKWMPIQSALGGESLTERSLKILLNEIGYHRVNLSMMLAGASWAVFATKSLVSRNLSKILIIAASLSILFAQALTGGRAGYASWAMVGLCMCLMRWRKYLLFVPIATIAIIVIVPGVYERMAQGFSPETRDFNARIHSGVQEEGEHDIYTITAGRNIAWPYVIDKIRESFLIGYGRNAMIREGISYYLQTQLGENFPHPHNASLEWILDNGILGAIPAFLFYAIILKYSICLFRDSKSEIFIAVGGVTFALVSALFFASIGSQTFYPREGSVGMWCAIGLMLRVYQQRRKVVGAKYCQVKNIAKESQIKKWKRCLQNH